MVKEKPRKPSLGRGLSVLLAQAEETYAGTADQSAAQIRRVSVDQLQPGKYQPRRRFDAEAIAGLAESIRAKGVLQPLLVRPAEGGKYEIIAGERRWRAAQLAAVHELPVLIQNFSDAETLEIGLIENLQRQDLNALEEAEAYQKLMDEFGHTQQNLADTVGKSRSHIANTLRLLVLPDAVKTMIVTDRLTAGHARAIMSSPNVLALAETIAEKGLSVREAERLAAAPPRSETKPSAVKTAKRSADLVAIEADLCNRLGLKVKISAHGEAGQISVFFGNLEQFDDVLARLSRSA
jgi:ParB family chromosome partitioning protein